MTTIMLLVNRKPGITSAEFRRHDETNHAPLAASPLKHLLRHVRNFVIEQGETPPDQLLGTSEPRLR